MGIPRLRPCGSACHNKRDNVCVETERTHAAPQSVRAPRAQVGATKKNINKACVKRESWRLDSVFHLRRLKIQTDFKPGWRLVRGCLRDKMRETLRGFLLLGGVYLCGVLLRQKVLSLIPQTEVGVRL